MDETNLLLRKSIKDNLTLDCDKINIEICEKLDTAKKVINEIGESIDNINVDTSVDEIKNRWEGRNKSKLKKKFEKCMTLSKFCQVLIKRKSNANKPATSKWYKRCDYSF